MSLYPQIKEFLLGKTLPTSAHSEERLTNAVALAVLSSDALSSVAYATEEILLVLVAAGSRAFRLSLPVAMAIILLLMVVMLSYGRPFELILREVAPIQLLLKTWVFIQV